MQRLRCSTSLTSTRPPPVRPSHEAPWWPRFGQPLDQGPAGPSVLHHEVRLRLLLKVLDPLKKPEGLLELQVELVLLHMALLLLARFLPQNRKLSSLSWPRPTPFQVLHFAVRVHELLGPSPRLLADPSSSCRRHWGLMRLSRARWA